MRFALLGVGSRGDIQPFIALGAGLRARGHDVILSAATKFDHLAHTAGLEFADVRWDPDEFHGMPEVLAAIRKGPSMIRVGRAMPRQSPAEVTRVMTEIHQATRGADAVVTSMFTQSIAIAQPQAPWCSTSWWPSVRTSAFPAMGAPKLPLGGRYNRLTYSFFTQFEWMISRSHVNSFRKDRGLPALGWSSPMQGLGDDIPILYPYSPEVLPAPDDWPSKCHVTGYWYWHRKWTPPVQLMQFLESGPPPLLMTFGSSWPSHWAGDSLLWASTAARQLGRRLIVIDGPAESLPEGVLQLHEVDYLHLFPHMAAVIHHGSYGTTAAAVHAGIPQVIVPAYADQPFWAAQMHKLGVAAPTVPFAKLTAERLGAAISAAVRDRTIRDRAKALGLHVRAENGVTRACELLETYASGQSGTAL